MRRKSKSLIITERSRRQARLLLDDISRENTRTWRVKRRVRRGLLFRRRIVAVVFILALCVMTAGVLREFFIL